MKIKTNILRNILTPTAEQLSPTDHVLDEEIRYVAFVLHEVLPMLGHIVSKKTWRFFRYKFRFILTWLGIIVLVSWLGWRAFLMPPETKSVYVGPGIDTCMHYRSDTSMNLRNFMQQIAYIESSYNKYANRPSSEYLGLYQLGNGARKVAGYGDVPKDVFLNHAEIQDMRMIEFLRYNKKCMQSYIDKYSGKIIDGILVTESGILGLSHLGCGSAQKYLDSGRIPVTDENGNPVRLFLKLGGYNLNL